MLTSIFSAGNTYTYCAIRNLYGLSLEGRAPRFLSYCTRKGVPIYCFCVVMIFPLLSFLQCSNSSSVVITWFASLVTAGGAFARSILLLQWIADALNRTHRLLRYVTNLHLLLPRLQSTRAGSEDPPLYGLVPAVLRLFCPCLDVRRRLHLWLHLLLAVVRLKFLFKLHNAAFYSASLHYLEVR